MTFALSLLPSFQSPPDLQSPSRIYCPAGYFSSVISLPDAEGKAMRAAFVTVRKVMLRAISSLSSAASWEEQRRQNWLFQRCPGKGRKALGIGHVKAGSGCSERLCHLHSWRNLKQTGECPSSLVYLGFSPAFVGVWTK